VVLSAALLVAAVWLGHKLAERLGAWSATLVAGAGYVVAVAILMVVLPTIDETPNDFPAGLLYEFRLYSLGTQLVLWAVIAVVFASMAHRLLGEPQRQEISVPA
jgi:predicted cobalt transporter CbtA